MIHHFILVTYLQNLISVQLTNISTGAHSDLLTGLSSLKMTTVGIFFGPKLPHQGLALRSAFECHVSRVAEVEFAAKEKEKLYFNTQLKLTA